MKKWEYRMVDVRTMEGTYSEAVKELNRLGKDGWELVATANNWVFFLKREDLVVETWVEGKDK